MSTTRQTTLRSLNPPRVFPEDDGVWAGGKGAVALILFMQREEGIQRSAIEELAKYRPCSQSRSPVAETAPRLSGDSRESRTHDTTSSWTCSESYPEFRQNLWMGEHDHSLQLRSTEKPDEPHSCHNPGSVLFQEGACFPQLHPLQCIRNGTGEPEVD